MPIASPCVKLCVLDDRSGLCQGCGRTIEEIAAWTGLDDDRRAMIMAEAPGRLARSRGDRLVGVETAETRFTTFEFDGLSQPDLAI